ncbi:UDP-N-acetylmuramoyl-L-alanyl-D-glutamate--2,6-diaminopimelate ligase [Parafilimonas terrae]|uniref:UDP-N-acetylmuramoyl-L-alanyl-D-glutamate--2,6-diaminopimelate ligase n=1 Tax=Parafilimonas terrae TaxID=1465490 RepID=A0A1I5Z9T3_9BACT|nr:UDP-N-acetylmuramoyl-L-alanyl-D-glutamate--2,6-diaminopimelate ligase [Parafilimonas terrae]SFQ53203.1 UDP-N-acetylmuramoylalanyl-D-glutamate--2,6-diaminopimelate ligase [Parafilimonas terrae]
MKKLEDILYKVRIIAIHGSRDVNVNSITIDSRKVHNGSVFIAIKGEKVDGHDFIQQSINSGAAIIVCEELPALLYDAVTYIQVKNAHEAVAYIAHNFYDEPSKKLKLVGVTGTNGKTTIATLLFKLFSSLEYKCGLISTVQNQIASEIIPSTHTTPDAISLNALLKQMADGSCTHVFMECSSHAIHQHRITGLHFAGGIFSNITHDHLDYHKTFDEYIRVKKSFFDNLTSDAFALSNLDEKRGTVMLQNTPAKKYYYSLKNVADFKGKILENALTGLVMLVNDKEVHFLLIGEFNAYNLLAVYGAAICLGEESEKALLVLSSLTGAEGRFDYIISKEKIIGIVDYAHTPDALENVLSTIKKLRRGDEQVITVVGCGGDRDKTKRPEMAEIAAALSTRTIFTSDNPRSEDPAQILKDMEAGLNSAGRRKSISIVDRKEAIKTAVSFANAEDIILLAGKGHEKYQVIGKQKLHFDDKEVLREMFELLKK